MHNVIATIVIVPLVIAYIFYVSRKLTVTASPADWKHDCVISADEADRGIEGIVYVGDMQ